MYAEIVGNLLHGVDAGLECPGHRLAPLGVAPGEVREGLGEGAALGARDFAQAFRGPGRDAVALRKRLAAEEDLVAQPLPDARLSDPPANDGGLAVAGAGTLSAELPEQPVGLQPIAGGCLSDHRPVAAPGPGRRLRDHRRAHGIEHHVARQLQQVGVALDQDGLEPTLEEVAHEPVAAIDPLRVDAVELTHPFGEVGIGRLDDEVIVVRHLAIGMAAPVEPAAHIAEHREPRHAVLIVVIDRLAPITARGDVIEPAGKLDTEGSGHGPECSSAILECKT